MSAHAFVARAVVAAIALSAFVLPAATASAEPPCEAPEPPPFCTPPPVDEPGEPFGHLDVVQFGPAGVRVAGWAIDPDTSEPIGVHIYVDGRAHRSVTASVPRPDVGDAHPGYGNGHGFDITLDDVPAGRRAVCVYGANVGPGADGPNLGCAMVSVTATPFGNLDVVQAGPAGVRVAGWGIDPNSTAPIGIHIYVDGQFSRAITASASRPDVAAAHPAYGAEHGFDFTYDMPRGKRTVCAYAINTGPGSENPELGCSDVWRGGPPGAPGVTVSLQGSGVLVRVAPTGDARDQWHLGVWRDGQAGPPYAKDVASRNSATATPFNVLDTSVTPGGHYCYGAVARNGDYPGSSWSAPACIDVPRPPLPRPTDLFTTEVTASGVLLHWNDNATDEEAYRVSRSGDTRTIAANPGTGPMTLRVSGLAAGTRYCYSITPLKAGHTEAAADLCFTTSAAQVPVNGVKAVNLWNCASERRAGAVWTFDQTTGAWRRVGDLPSSWTPYGCGPAYSAASGRADLPHGHRMTIVMTLAGSSTCPTENIQNQNCWRWSAANVLGDTNGITAPVAVG